MRAPILLLCSLIVGAACGRAAAVAPGSPPAAPTVAVLAPGVEAELTLDVLELI